MGDSRVDFLSKEAVSGELLSDRLARGSLSPADTLRYAIEIGSALHKAHSRGLVHGGLSPSSIGLTTGSARILEATSCPEEHAAYRAPELLRGEEPDPCSDVFAYGALLYEMASGRRAFPGEGAELNQQILTQAPEPLTKSTTSSAMEAVIAGCLDKDRARRQRVQNAVTELKLAGRQPPLTGEAARSPSVRRAIERVSSDSSAASLTGSLTGTVAAVQDAGAVLSAATPTDTPTRVAARRRVYRLSFKPRAWAIVGGLLAVVAIWVGATMFLRPKPAPPVLKFAVIQPENTSYPGMPSVSPDGRYLAFSAVGQEGKRMLWLRPLDALRATVVQGSEGASAPFWSPDSQAFAFFGGKSLKKVKITGGTPENICAAEASPGGGAWNTNGTILFAPGLSDGLYRVPASGGKPQLVLKLAESKAERADLWPQCLPDGKHFVFYQQTDFTETSGVYVGSMDQPEYHRLFTSQTNAVLFGGTNGYPEDRLFAVYPRGQPNGTAVQYQPPRTCA